MISSQARSEKQTRPAGSGITSWCRAPVNTASIRNSSPGAAIRKLGNLYRGGYPDTDSVPEFMGAFLNDHNIKQFHMELVSLTDDEAVVHFHYCPMCGAWTKLTDNEKEIGMICDCAMDVDRGVFDLYEHIGFKLEKAIGCGDNVCELHFVRK